MKPNILFCNHAVLQAHKEITIFGEGHGKVTVKFLNEEFTTNSTNNQWLIKIPPKNYGGPYTLAMSDEKENVIINDVYVGEVFLCAGQSNMQFTISEETGNDILLENDIIRTFVVDRVEEYEGLKIKDGWVTCSSNSVKKWSAIGYHIAQNINLERNIAIGIIGCYQGASNIQSWIQKDILFNPLYQIDKNLMHGDVCHPLYSQWNINGKLYTHIIKKIIPYTISSVVWYQGESNTSIAEGKIYTSLLKALIDNWRNAFKQHDLHFTIIEICDFTIRNDDAWRLVQKAQRNIVNHDNNVYVISSSDVCEHDNIHPPCKIKLSKKISDYLLKLI